MVRIADRNDLLGWIEGKPRAVTVSIAARAALRALPSVADYIRGDPGARAATLVLPMFRALGAPRVAGAWLTRGAGVRTAAASRAAADAAYTTSNAAAYGASHAAKSATASYVASHAAYAASRAAYAAAASRADATDAAADAVDAAAAASRADAATFWRAISADVSIRENNGELARPMWPPLWRDHEPKKLGANWKSLKRTLLSLDANWQVWTTWYDDILRGAYHPDSRPLIEDLEVARVLIPDDDWRRGPAHVNSLIADLEAKYRSKAPQPEEVGADDPTAAQFRALDHAIDADSLAGRDEVATDPIARDLHGGALTFAQTAHEVFAASLPGTNRPRSLASTLARLIEASGTAVTTTRPGLLIPLAAALQVALDADARRQRDPDLEGAPLSADEREALANASNAYKTWINTDPYLSALEGARLRTAAEPMDVDAVDAVVAAAVDQGAATPAAQALVNDAKDAGPESQFFNGTVLNFFRRGLKIAAVTAAGTGAAAYSGAKIAAWLVANEAAVLRLLASRPELLDVATRLIAILKQMPLAGVL